MALDRLAFGARPGDVERVRAMGVDRWIQQQLSPERIPDADVERRVADLKVMKLSSAELMANYPGTKMLLRQNGMLKAKVSDKERKELLRRSLAQGHGRARDVYDQLAADRLLRATYSERQLQEVMVDFWSNHFNVFAHKENAQWYLPSFDRDVIRPHAAIIGREPSASMARAIPEGVTEV